MKPLKDKEEIDAYIYKNCEEIYSKLYAIMSKDRLIWFDKHFYHDLDTYEFDISWWQFNNSERQSTIIKWCFEFSSPQAVFDMVKLTKDLGYNEIRLIVYIPDPYKNIGEEKNEYDIKKNTI